MKKQDLISEISKNTDVSKANVEKVLNSFIDQFGQTLKETGFFQLYGFGTFKVNVKDKLRNPKTNEILVGKKIKCISYSQGDPIKKVINSED